MGDSHHPPAAVLDLRGYRCPTPVIRLETALRRLPQHAQVAVFADDPLAAVDIPQFCRAAGHEIARLPADPPDCGFLVTRAAKPA